MPIHRYEMPIFMLMNQLMVEPNLSGRDELPGSKYRFISTKFPLLVLMSRQGVWSNGRKRLLLHPVEAASR